MGCCMGLHGIALQNSIAQLVLANMDEAVRAFLSALSPTACTGASSDTIALFSMAAIDTALEKVRSRTAARRILYSNCHPCALPSATVMSAVCAVCLWRCSAPLQRARCACSANSRRSCSRLRTSAR